MWQASAGPWSERQASPMPRQALVPVTRPRDAFRECVAESPCKRALLVTVSVSSRPGPGGLGLTVRLTSYDVYTGSWPGFSQKRQMPCEAVPPRDPWCPPQVGVRPPGRASESGGRNLGSPGAPATAAETVQPPSSLFSVDMED